MLNCFYQTGTTDALQKRSPAASAISIIRATTKHFQIPLPPLEVQKEIVAEIEGYQKVIDGARAVLDNYRPHIPIHPDWPMVELGEVCEINPETINPVSEYPNQTVFYVDISSVESETGRFLGYKEIASSEAPSRARRGIRGGDVLLSTVRPNLKAFTLLREVCDRAIASTGFAVLRARNGVAEPAFILAWVSSDHAVSQMVAMMGKGAYPSINQSDVSAIRIPLPPLATQQRIVAEIETERALVSTNRELITRFEKKMPPPSPASGVTTYLFQGRRKRWKKPPELYELPAALLQEPEGAGIHRLSLGRVRDQLHPRQIPVRLPRLPHAHHELRLFQHLADQAGEPWDFEKA